MGALLKYFKDNFHFINPIDSNELLVYNNGVYEPGEWIIKQKLEEILVEIDSRLKEIDENKKNYEEKKKNIHA